jgi:inositol phosphorylceramide mannosyltransferase catalytic subunit
MFRKPLRFIKETLNSFYDIATSYEVAISSNYTRVPPRSQKIPNVVYQTWRKPVLPLRHARGLARFRNLNKDYSFCFFDDSRMAEYMHANYSNHPICGIFDDIMIPASKADVWRYCILLKEGGIYCDIDSALTKPLRELLSDDPSELISFERNTWNSCLGLGFFADPAIFLSFPPQSVASRLDHPDHIILNWLLCFEKGSPILTEVIDLIVRHADFYRGKVFGSPMLPIMHFTGPLALTQAVWMYIQRSDKRPRQDGIDFDGHGIFKLPGEIHRYSFSPHYSTMPSGEIIRRRQV